MYRAVTFAALPRRARSERRRRGRRARPGDGDRRRRAGRCSSTVSTPPPTIRWPEVTAAVSVVAANTAGRGPSCASRQRAWASRARRRGDRRARHRHRSCSPTPTLKLLPHGVAARSGPRRRTAEIGGDVGAIADGDRAARPASTRPAPTSPLREADGVGARRHRPGARSTRSSTAIVALLGSPVSETSEVRERRSDGDRDDVRRERLAGACARTACAASAGVRVLPGLTAGCSVRGPRARADRRARYVARPGPPLDTSTRRSSPCVTAAACATWARTRCGSSKPFRWLPVERSAGSRSTRGTADREALQRCIAGARGRRTAACCSPRASASPVRSCSRCSTAPPTSP